MVKLSHSGAYVLDRCEIIQEFHKEINIKDKTYTKEELRKNTLTYKILEKHNRSENMDELKLAFDSITSHDLTYVGVVQTAKASGLKEFPVPYILTNCHNSLCAVGGTLNEDDHVFGLSAAKKYGGIYVPPHQAVIHQYMREMYAGCGSMILGSDSHTRYGALGTLAIGEGGGELVKQLLGKTYDIAYPDVIGIYLKGKPRLGIGPQDVALAIIRGVFKNGYVKNKVMEFFGDGIANLSMDFRNGIDVMTTETACLSSIWETDEITKEYLEIHERSDAYKEMKVSDCVYYDRLIEIDLSKINSMIALPFHPSNAYEISELYENLEDILYETEKEGLKLYEGMNIDFNLRSKVKNGKLYAQQGVIGGCAGGTFENIMETASILENRYLGKDVFALSIYPASQPVMLELIHHNAYENLLQTGATIRTAFCGPCFGAGDVPANGQLSIRHNTRNFPNREGSKPGQGQLASVALMDARSIAATAMNGGIITAASEIEYKNNIPKYSFNNKIYSNRIYNGFKQAEKEEELVYGPNIKDWPQIGNLENHILLKVCSFITDPVTTTDELIPSGDTATFRSNPQGLAEFTLYRKDPDYVPKAKAVQKLEEARAKGNLEVLKSLDKIYESIKSIDKFKGVNVNEIGLGSVIYAKKPGDGSAREQAASCQRVLGGCANISVEYATKRYRSNLINWGMIPFVLKDSPVFDNDSYIFVPNIVQAIKSDCKKIKAYAVDKDMKEFTLEIGELTENEKQILLDGCLINHYKKESL